MRGVGVFTAINEFSVCGFDVMLKAVNELITELPFRLAKSMTVFPIEVRFGSLADIQRGGQNVCFVPLTDERHSGRRYSPAGLICLALMISS